MSSRDATASDQDLPNKRIRLSEPIAKQEPVDGANGNQSSASKTAVVSRADRSPFNTAPSQTPKAPTNNISHRHASEQASPATTPSALPRVKLEDIAGAQQLQSSRPISLQQTIHNGKPTPPNLQKMPLNQSQTGPSTPSPATVNGAVRPNPMLTSHTSRYVYPAAATPMMSRTPSAGNGIITPSGNPSSQLSQSIPPRTQHPLSATITQNHQGRFIPSSAALRTPNTPSSAYSVGSGMIPGRSVTNPQATPSRASPLSASLPSAMAGMRNGVAGPSRGATPTQIHQSLVPIPRPRTAEDMKTIRETEQLLKRFLEMDQKATTESYLSDEPFRDSRDVVDRLLPFHIWQIHDEDLDFEEKSRERKVAERQQVIQMANKKIELERRVRALRVKGDKNLRNLGYIQVHQSVLPDFRDAQARAQGVIRTAQLENERIVHEYRRRNADILRLNEERRTVEMASKRNILEQARTTPATPGFSVGTEMKPHITPQSIARINPMQIPSASPLYVPPAHTSKPVDIRVPMTMLSQLSNLNIIRSPGADSNAVTNLPAPPATIVRTAEDMSHIIISVNLTAVNAAQLAFLAELVKQQTSNKGTSTPNRIGTSSAAATPAPARPRPVGQSLLQAIPRTAATPAAQGSPQNFSGIPNSKPV